MTEEKELQSLTDNSQRISSIRATVGVIEEMRLTANEMAGMSGRVLLTDQERLIALVDFVRLNMKEKAQ